MPCSAAATEGFDIMANVMYFSAAYYMPVKIWNYFSISGERAAWRW